MKEKCGAFTNRVSREKIIIFSIIISFLFWVIFLFVGGINSYQWSIFNGKFNDFLADLLNVIGYSADRDVYNNTSYTGVQEKAYPPLTYMFSYFLSRFVDIEKYYKANRFLDMYKEPKLLMVYIIILVSQIVFIYELTFKLKKGSNINKIFAGIAVIVSYPMIASYERGNTIIFATGFIMFYIINFDSESKILRELSYISLAIAAALKITPALLGIILLIDKRWKAAIRTVLYGLFFFFIPFMFFKGGFSNIEFMIRNSIQNNKMYESFMNITLLGVLNYYKVDFPYMNIITRVVSYFLGIILLIATFFSKDKFDRVLFITNLMVVIPSHSALYTLLYFIPSFILFIDKKKSEDLDWMMVLAILMIMIPFRSVLQLFVFNCQIGIVLIMGYSLYKAINTLKESENKGVLFNSKVNRNA